MALKAQTAAALCDRLDRHAKRMNVMAEALKKAMAIITNHEVRLADLERALAEARSAADPDRPRILAPGNIN